ncbi:hypothetical protein H696_05922 [Fonticula alba]|uniref:Uncharacterized protein n=1 Tax=Fonticula alba TaxID=691883 RepID=A0A058Z059_FONAL|nr:hypothetical protein H696_05922 [Fonticula alba]KCV67635.1 hypothetical protein H696_05922 [Fonticula alba]|eukprot:XP_009497973.1 hypothetical protein H696_05922 [Fonticula alba]
MADLFHRDCLVGYLAQKSGVAAGHPHARPEQLAQHMQLKDIENVPCPSCVKPVLPAPGNLGPLASRLRAFFEETFRPMAGSQFSSQSTVDLSAPGGGPASGGGNTIGPGPITPGGGTYQSHLPGGMPGVSHPGGPAPGPEAAGLYIPPAVATAPAPGDVYIPMRSRSIADDDDKDKYRSKSSLKGRSPMLRAGAFSPSRRARRLMLSFVLMATIMLLLYYVIQSSDRGTGPGVPPGGAPVPAAGAAAAAGAPY